MHPKITGPSINPTGSQVAGQSQAGAAAYSTDQRCSPMFCIAVCFRHESLCFGTATCMNFWRHCAMLAHFHPCDSAGLLGLVSRNQQRQPQSPASCHPRWDRWMLHSACAWHWLVAGAPSWCNSGHFNWHSAASECCVMCYRNLVMCAMWLSSKVYDPNKFVCAVMQLSYHVIEVSSSTAFA